MATAGCIAWASVTSDLHPLSAAGYLILSVEALVVTFWWPRLYPPAGRKRSESSARHRRQRRRSRHLGSSGSTVFFGGATPSPTINGQRFNTNGGKASSRWSGDSSGWWESDGGLEGLSEAGRSSAPSSLVSIGGRRRRAARLQSGQSGGGGFFGEEPLETFPEKRSAVDGDVRVPLPSKSRMRYARPVLLVLLTLSASYLTTWLLLSISLARISTAVDEGAMSNTRDIEAMKKAAEVERRVREEREEAANRMELEEKALQEAVAAEEARQEQREAEIWKDQERKALADAEEKRLAEARALEKQQRERRAREEQKARDEKKAKDEQAARLREQKARYERKSRDAAAAKAKLEAEQRKKRAKMAATLEQRRSIGLEDALTNGSTELRVMPNGDLVLADNGRPVWTARGSKKRRSLVGWIWRKIRRQQAVRPCTACRLTVAPEGRVELREEGKLLWSGGQRQKKARQQKRQTTQQRKRVPRANDREGADGSGAFRLVITDDGNAILEREGSEVVWKALNR
ncbi:unnamed protein product [Ectocarpus sp. CCAP 1310/34]|nr:unnamed protein product [Ectocarpus sp. CCAP 1310/34]